MSQWSLSIPKYSGGAGVLRYASLLHLWNCKSIPPFPVYPFVWGVGQGGKRPFNPQSWYSSQVGLHSVHVILALHAREGVKRGNPPP